MKINVQIIILYLKVIKKNDVISHLKFIFAIINIINFIKIQHIF